VILVPGLDRTLHAVPRKHVLVRIGDDAGLQRDQRVRDLEGRGRQLALTRALLVAGDDQIVLDLVADEGARCTEIGESLCQAVADLVSRRRDVGERALRQDRSGGEKPRVERRVSTGKIR